MLRSAVFAALLACCLAVPRPLKPLPSPVFPMHGRIVGGSPVGISAVPHQLVFQWQGSYICGASLIRSDAVISADHCTFSNNPSDYSFRGGSDYYYTGGQVIGVQRLWTHNTDDVAVFLLSSSFELSEKVNVIALPQQGLVIPDGTPASASGWGAVTEGGSISDVVLAVDLPIVGYQRCYDAYASAGYRIQESEVCAGVLGEGGKDACQGDSGGPLVVDGVLVGVTSWGIGCARPNYPGVWAGVAAVRDWIDSNLS